MTLRKKQDFLLSSKKFNATIAAFNVGVAVHDGKWFVTVDGVRDETYAYDFKPAALRGAGWLAKQKWLADLDGGANA